MYSPASDALTIQEDDVHKSLKFNIWASTEIGNRRLDKAYRESSRAGPIYLFFSVNARYYLSVDNINEQWTILWDG